MHNTRKQLARKHLFEVPQNYMESKSEGNKNKIILGDFNCNMDKTDRDGGNKTQRLYRCDSNHDLSKSPWIIDSRIYREVITQIPLISPTTIDPLPKDPT